MKVLSSLSLFVIIFSGFTLIAGERSLNPVPSTEAKEIYKRALNQATAANTISAPEGFVVEVVRSANSDEGSWIALEFGANGELFVAREDRGILRLNLDTHGQLIQKASINETLQQCRGLLWAHNSLYVHSNGNSAKTSGVFRLQDNNVDGEFETIEQLLVGGAHSDGDQGRNQLRLGPDGKIYFMCGSRVEISEQINTKQSFLRNFEEEDLIPNPWDLDGYSYYGSAPGGHLVRMCKDGGNLQLVAGGFANPMDVVFNRDQEMFTFDGDSEWDSALPWYRPSRVLHVVAGADFGWRRGTSKWPDYYEDSLPPVLNIGLSVPTGMEFGYESKFPKNWQDRLFVGDWAYGRIIAVDLKPQGGSYRSAGYQTFVYGRPLNIVDMTFGPDGHLYFVTGGRKTKSAIYRVKWEGQAPEIIGDGSNNIANNHLLRRKLEHFHLLNEKSGNQSWPPDLAYLPKKDKQAYLKKAVDLALENIDHEDHFIRHAARLVLENQNPELWLSQALKSESPSAFIAIARGGLLGDGALVKRMNKIQLNQLPEERILGMLRAYQICFIRNGMPSRELKKQLADQLIELFPTKSERINHEVFELLVYLDTSRLMDKFSELINGVETTESLAQYLVFSRYLNNGWNLETRRHFLQAVQRLEAFPGGEKHTQVIERLRTDIANSMSQPERLALAKWMRAKADNEEGDLVDAGDQEQEDLRVWAVDDFSIYYNHDLRGRNYERGKHIYKYKKCAECHDNQQIDEITRGPELGEMRRKSLYQLVVGIVHPSRVIDDKYRDPAIPNLSAMPAGLINGMDKDEVLDLLAYLKSGGNDAHPVYRGRAVDVERIAESKLPRINENKSFGDLIQPGPHDELDLPHLPKVRNQLTASLFKRNSAVNDDRQRIFNEMQKIRENYPHANFEFVGHADDTQWDQTNYDISVNRARFTVDYLAYLGMPRGIMSYRGVGAKEPSDISNRRVEIIVKY